MADAAPGLRTRPLSPHIMQWRWHVTMAASILTRFTGIALYGGALLLAIWALALASGPESYGLFMGLIGSMLGRLILVALTFSVFYHLAAGIRHLVFDVGKGLAPATASLTAWLIIGFAVVATFGVWAYAYVTGLL